jgi:GNAT superfamily N-acetyltransferase
MRFREYNPDTDRAAAHRIWREIGWMREGDEEPTDLYFTGGRTWVAELEGEPECLSQTMSASVRYLEEEMPAAVLAAVATSHVARQRGLAKRLMAHLLALDAADGALLSIVGYFDQGYYNHLGFGNGSYEVDFDFDPATLMVSDRARTPRRFTRDDWEILHAAHLSRRPVHGRCNYTSPVHFRVETAHHKTAFGLGYCDTPDGSPSHCLWLNADNMNAGPYRVEWMVFRTPEQFRELMALLRSFEDQVRLIHLRQPPGLQFQDMLSRPLRQRSITHRGGFENAAHVTGGWQVRLLDLPGALARTHLMGAPVRFNLLLRDPIADLLDDGAPWRGIGGEYVVAFGEESSATPGQSAALPTLTASVNAFSRMWFGVRAASDLAYTDELSGPPELLQQLDETLRLPEPNPDCEL